MKLLFQSLIIAGLAFGACQPFDQVSKTDIVDTVEAMEIKWEDLMPVGEEARLAEMYTDYYEDLETRMFQDAQRLQDLAKNDGSATDDESFDVTSIAEGSANDTMEQIGTFNVVDSLNGVKIRMPGYVVPLDFNADNEYTEFLLVPYFGACLHTPPPPPNQIVFVTSKQSAKVESIYDPVWIEGVMTTGEFNSDLANTAYQLDLSKIEPYAY